MSNFARFVYWILDSRFRKFLVILLTLLAFVGSVMMLGPVKLVKARMLPGKSDNTYSVYIDTPTGSAKEQTMQVAECVIDILKGEPEIMNMELFAGEGIPLDYAGLVKGAGMKNSENVAELSVNLTNKHSRKEPSFLMVQRLRPVIKQKCEPIVPGTVVKMIEQPAGPPTLASIVVEVTGDNLEKMRELSVETAKILSQTETLVDVDIMADDIFDRYELIPDKEKIARSALSVKQVNQIIYLAFEGMAIAHKNSRHEPDQIDIFLRLDEKTKRLKRSFGNW